MGKRWAKEQEEIILEQYVTAPSVDYVANLVGRTRVSVIKKALSMGLRRPELQQESIARLQAVLGDVPMSVVEIAAAMKMTSHATNELLRRYHEKGICHISGFRPCVGRGKDKPLWVAGKGENALTDYAKKQAECVKKVAKETAAPVKAFRDPLQEALFGRARPVDLSPLPAHVYKQPMTVTDDELEAA